MTPEQHKRAKEVFSAARELSPEERAAFIARECDDDVDLLMEVDSLLNHGANPTASVLETPASGKSSFQTPAQRMVGQRIGRYHIRQMIASGGMGTVFLAVQEEPHRAVAIKLMNHGVASKSAMRRFEFEAQLLARLRHPNVAHVYEAGTHDDGRGVVPYFAMEFIPAARPITFYALMKRLGTRERLALFAKVCNAVNHGHQKGIIHRDLKPTNILVDANGEPKIIDFGVARSTDSDMAVTTLQTDIGQLIGTLQYMSPEQCEADPHNIDTRSDVYALGVILYELVCHRLPYEVAKLPIHEATRLIQESAPPRPSTVNRTLRGDVETIVLKAIEKDRTRRYQTAAELEGDIRRYLDGGAIGARPPSAIYQIRLFAKRNRTVFASVSAIIALLLCGVVVAVFLLLRLDQRNDELNVKIDELNATSRLRDSDQQASETNYKNWQAASAEVGRLTTNLENADQKTQYAFQGYWQLISDCIADADPASRLRQARVALGRVPDDERTWEWRFLDATITNRMKNVCLDYLKKPGGSSITALTCSDRQIMWGSRDGRICVVTLDSNSVLRDMVNAPSPITGIEYSADGLRHVWSTSDGYVGVEMSLQDRRLFDRMCSGECTVEVAANPMNPIFAIANGSAIATWTFMPLELDRVFSGSTLGTVTCLSYSPDGRLLIAADWDGNCELFGSDEAWTAREWSIGRGAREIVWMPSGQSFVVRLSNSISHVRGEEVQRDWVQCDGVFTSMALLPDASRLVTGHTDGRVRLWDTRRGTLVLELPSCNSAVLCVCVTPDGERIIAGTQQGAVQVWDSKPLSERPFRRVIEGS